jgi:hypothetical protein
VKSGDLTEIRKLEGEPKPGYLVENRTPRPGAETGSRYGDDGADSLGTATGQETFLREPGLKIFKVPSLRDGSPVRIL